MISNRNLITISGGLTKDAQKFDNAEVVHLSIAVDGAGSEKGVQNAPGYFDAKVWLTDSKFTPAATGESVRKLLEEGALTKGARVSVVGHLVQERWVKDGQRSARVVIMIDNIDVFRPRNSNTPNNSSQSNSQPAMASASTSRSSSSDFDEF